MQHRSLRRTGQTLLPNGNEHEPKLLHRPGHEVCIRRLRLVRKQRRRYLLLHHAHLIEQQHDIRVPGQRSGLQQLVFFERRLFHLRNAGQSLLSRQQVQRQRLLLQRTMRGRVHVLRTHDGGYRRNHRHQPRRVHRGQVRWLRRLGTAVLWIHLPQLWCRPLLSQQHVFVLWRSR